MLYLSAFRMLCGVMARQHTRVVTVTPEQQLATGHAQRVFFTAALIANQCLTKPRLFRHGR